MLHFLEILFPVELWLLILHDVYTPKQPQIDLLNSSKTLIEHHLTEALLYQTINNITHFRQCQGRL
jgi:hypothetical protein